MKHDQGIKLEDGKAVCENCGQWQYTETRKPGKIVHSRRCDTPDAQYGQFMAPASAPVKEPSPFALQAGEDIYDRDQRLVKQRHMTESDAMNTDY